MDNAYISFPGLGIKLPISDTIVEFPLFGQTFSIKWYGLMIAIGFILAVLYSLRRAKVYEIDPDRMIDVVLVSTLAAFIGARLYYCVFSEQGFGYWLEDWRIFKVWEGGLAIYGGIIFAFLCAILMCRVRKVNMWAMFDAAGLGFLIGQGLGRWGNFFNQEAYGGMTELPWRMNGSRIMSETIQSELGYFAEQSVLDGAGVHPTFLYESLWCIAGFVALHFLSKKLYTFKGQLFCGYIVWYGLGRAWIEGLRTDSLYFGAIRVSQMVAILSVIGGVILFFILKGRHERLPVNLFTPDPEEEEAADDDDGEPSDEETAGDEMDNDTDAFDADEGDAEAEEDAADDAESTIPEATQAANPAPEAVDALTEPEKEEEDSHGDAD